MQGVDDDLYPVPTQATCKTHTQAYVCLYLFTYFVCLYIYGWVNILNAYLILSKSCGRPMLLVIQYSMLNTITLNLKARNLTSYFFHLYCGLTHKLYVHVCVYIVCNKWKFLLSAAYKPPPINSTLERFISIYSS